MKKAISVIMTAAVLCFFFSACSEILSPEANGRWNPADPSYDPATDPAVAGVPIITFKSETDTATPGKTADWEWVASLEDCTYRYEITESEKSQDLESQEFSDATTASLSSGNGIRYIHVQAKAPDGTLGPVASAGALLDNTPPAAATGFTADAGAEQVSLSWTNPSSDFAGVEIRYGTGDYPATVQDGLSAYEGTGSSYTLTGLDGGETYYFSAYAYDAAENYAAGVTASATPAARRFVYIADGDSGMAVIEVTDPENPGDPVYRPMSVSPIRIDANESYAFLVADNGLMIVNIVNPLIPGSPVLAPGTGSFSLQDVVVSGDYAFMADSSTYALITYDVSDPAHLTSPNTPITPDGHSGATGIAVSGNYAYLAAGSYDIASIDISSPSSFTVGAGAYTSLGFSNARDICVSGNYAYLTDSSDHYLAVCDISTPGSPGAVHTASTSGTPNGVAVSGYFAYVAAGNNLDIFNISAPSSPVFSGSVETPGLTYDVAVSGNYAYVANGQAGMTIVNVDNSASPVIVKTVDTSGTAQGIVLK